MIINFSLENWRSFRDEVVFSMVASRERQHGERLPKIDAHKRILPIASIYGGNASGKTNFFDALDFVKKFVTEGSKLDAVIPVEPYKLDPEYAKKTTRFNFDLFIDEEIYNFSFSVTKKAVVEEKLILVKKKKDIILYHRINGEIKFEKFNKTDEDLFLNFVFRGTRDNQLFLTNSVFQKVDHFRKVFNWFSESLQLISPKSFFEEFNQFFDEENPLYKSMNNIIPRLDTGMAHLGIEKVQFDSVYLPIDLKKEIQDRLKQGGELRIRSSMNDYYVISRVDGEIVAKKLVSFHNVPDGNEIAFDIKDESDGTQRVIDLLPAFFDLSKENSQKVYVIDEFDRSLHTLLTKGFVEAYLSSCSKNTRSQLLISAHDILLMTQDLFRRDEMWVVERNNGVSTLIALSDYAEIVDDKNIIKSYLMGRFGGIPKVRSGAGFSFVTKKEKSDE